MATDARMDHAVESLAQGRFTFHRDEDGSLSKESAVYQALGAASVSWSKPPKGVFDDVWARSIAEALLAELENHR